MISPGWALAGLLVVGALNGVSLASTRGAPVPSVDMRDDRAPVARAELTTDERDAFARLARHTGGRFIWSSNRAGNHDLYSVDLETLTLDRLTTHPHVDYFARVSPDGRWIAFVRSRRPRVSFRDAGGWDLHVMAADGGQERRLAARAVHPHWLGDGTGITFLRDNQVFVVDRASGVERALYKGGGPPTGGRIGDPVLGIDDLLCVALRAAPARGVGVVDLATRRYRPIGGRSACQCTWVPGTTQAVWVETGGHGGTRIMHAEAQKGEREVFMDVPGPYSHEYFPRVSADGQWLVWGASAAGHEHDQADYEMFAWRIGTPWDSAIRLTFSTSNDQWPELYNPR